MKFLKDVYCFTEYIYLKIQYPACPPLFDITFLSRCGMEWDKKSCSVTWRAGFSSRLVWAVFSDPSWFKELGLYRKLHPLCSKDSLQGWYLGIWGPACFLYKIWQVFFAPCLGGLGWACWRPVLDERHVAIGAEQFSLVCCFIHIYGEGQASLLSLMCCLCSNRQSKSVLGVMNVFQWDRGLSSRPIWSTLNFF